MSSTRSTIELSVGAEEHGERVDRLLARRDVASRSEAKRWIEAGGVTRGDEVLAPKSKVREGDLLRVQPLAPPPSEAEPEDLPLDIRYEDEHLVVVHKPAGVVVHPAPGHPGGTLVNALLFHVRFADAMGDPLRPGIVHRIDKDTSGVLVVAKGTAARDGLVHLFQTHDIDRRYEALVHGDPGESRDFDTLHGRHPKDRKRFSSRVERGKRAITHMKRVARFDGAAHVQCTLETGRTHQIRVHLSDAGHPILHDVMYGGRPRSERARRASAAIGRHALHAGLLAFRHPISGEEIRVEASAPPDFACALEVLRG